MVFRASRSEAMKVFETKHEIALVADFLRAWVYERGYNV